MTVRPPIRSRRFAVKAKAVLRPVEISLPRALRGQTFAVWADGGPGPLLRRLATEGAGGEVTLTPEELARLIELFRDEPLPESLRLAVTRQLRGRRARRQGVPRKRQSPQEQIELFMLPGAYAEALKDAKIERRLLKKLGRKRGRYDDPNKLPTASSIACNLVKTWLPTLKGQSNRSLLNLVSKVKKRLPDDQGHAPPSPPSED